MIGEVVKILHQHLIFKFLFSVLLMKGIRDLTKDSRTVKEKHDDYFRFTIPSMTVEDSGTYCVVVKNKFGIDRAFVTVRVS